MMNLNRSLLLALGCVLLLSKPVAAKHPIKDIVPEFAHAVRLMNWEAACSFASKETFEAYERYRRAALEFDRAKMEEISTLEVISVLSLRHEFSKSELEAATGKSLFVRSLQRRPIVTAAFFSRLEVSDLLVREDVAEGTARLNDSTTAMKVLFRREGGIWKWDLNHFGQQGNEGREKHRTELKLTKVDYAFRILQREHKDNVSPRIVDGPIDTEKE